MNILKNEKGVTLIALTITIIVMVIVTGTLIYNTNNQVQIQKIDKLYSDIEQIKDKVSEYYISNKKLPTKGKYCTSDELVNILKNNGASNSLTQDELLDSNDKKGEEQTYYVIDLSKMDNLTLNYGSQFKNWESGTTLQDLYIINEKSHQIYYPKGVEIDGKFYYARNIDLNSNSSSEVGNLEIIDNISDLIISSVTFENVSQDGKIHVANNSENSIKATLDVKMPNSNELLDISYALKRKTNSNEDLNRPEKFEICNSFVIDNNDGDNDNKTYHINIISQKMMADTYYLWIRLQDKNGNETITYKSINPNNELENNITNEIQMVEEEIELTVESSISGQVEVKIKYNPNELGNLGYGEGDYLDDAKSNINAIPGNTEYETDENGDRIYTLVVTREEYVVVTAKDRWENIAFSYIYTRIPVTGISISPSTSFSMIQGDTASLTATVTPNNATNQKVNWSISQNNNVASLSEENDNSVILSGLTPGNATITVASLDGEFTKSVNITVKPEPVHPTESSVPDSSTNIEKNYGTIEVIWLDEMNNVKSTPNEPNLYNNALKKVTWTKNGDIWVEDNTASNIWYNYQGVADRDTETNHTVDNLSSMWANAKNPTDGSYFVWIPRYAYRITYYESETSETPTGYYDGWGMWRAEDGKVKYALDSGIETVNYNKNKYIVHPAFETNLDNGGWSTDLSGFWVAKYEMSKENYNSGNWVAQGTNYSGGSEAVTGNGVRLVSKPSTETTIVSSWRCITISKMYSNSRNYDTAKNSHLIKNSEWGAVAYLAHSQYGRNANEIDINNSSDYCTGNGGGAVAGVASYSAGISNYYNTIIGAKASTTGNIYGVYDMSGGADECTAAWNNKNSGDLGNGSSFASTNGASTRYATAYSNETTSTYGNKGKVGDAIKEVNVNVLKSYGWFKDESKMLGGIWPFFKRGGWCQGGDHVGIFSSGVTQGSSNSGSYNDWDHATSYRIVLTP